ncbi:hypothetical protein NPIL_412071 [Nephila pilipes]|uniref:Uncharacterized protein n=1 Tax=Nephila pilipes TaxID=299642 RepID=A0A8X6TXR2_NEPPI|nr:hypothetical protein NPIL_412071 [Nephila pilipes]
MNSENQSEITDSTAKDQMPPLESVSSHPTKTPANNTPEPNERTEIPTEEFLADHAKEVLNLIQLRDAFAIWARSISNTLKEAATFQNAIAELERIHTAFSKQR